MDSSSGSSQFDEIGPRRQTTTTVIASTTTYDDDDAPPGDISDIGNVITSGGASAASVNTIVGNITAKHGNVSNIGNVSLHRDSGKKTSSVPKWLAALFKDATLPQKKLEDAAAYVKKEEINSVEDLGLCEGDLLVDFIVHLDFKLASVEKLESAVGVCVKTKLKAKAEEAALS